MPDWALGPEDTEVILFLAAPQVLEQCLAHSRHSINTCGLNELRILCSACTRARVFVQTETCLSVPQGEGKPHCLLFHISPPLLMCPFCWLPFPII